MIVNFTGKTINHRTCTDRLETRGRAYGQLRRCPDSQPSHHLLHLHNLHALCTVQSASLELLDQFTIATAATVWQGDQGEEHMQRVHVHVLTTMQSTSHPSVTITSPLLPPHYPRETAQPCQLARAPLSRGCKEATGKPNMACLVFDYCVPCTM